MELELFFDSEVLDQLSIKNYSKLITQTPSQYQDLIIEYQHFNQYRKYYYEEDLEEWFDNFESISESVGGTAAIKEIKLPTYLRGSALLVWENFKTFQGKVSSNRNVFSQKGRES